MNRVDQSTKSQISEYLHPKHYQPTWSYPGECSYCYTIVNRRNFYYRSHAIVARFKKDLRHFIVVSKLPGNTFAMSSYNVARYILNTFVGNITI